ncbi:MAG: transglycosylase domain-containing protein [bacterium]|nr:transglycosylase domain-containing protein [bacterium]
MNFSFKNLNWKTRQFKKTVIILLLTLTVSAFFLYCLKAKLLENYENLESVIITDRNSEVIATKQNSKGNYASYAPDIPEHFKNLLIKKEDRFFYFHFGINPFSTLRAAMMYLWSGVAGASSTITQQLAKNLLGNEGNRTLTNKLEETLYSLALELFLTKETILTMYGNTVYMGNQIQGLSKASENYFGKNLEKLTDTEALSLLATISSPSTQNPWKTGNRASLKTWAQRLNVAVDPETLVVQKSFKSLSDSNFELESLGKCLKSCTVTLDKNLGDKLRDILGRIISETSSYGGRNGAIVAIKLPENEALAIIGTPDTRSGLNGSAINMAIEPRPIGSTIKPFIYLKGFEKGLRPYTLVDDREYKFSIATGFPLYPKNYDGAYRGIITIEEALSGSLNVPTVKTLQHLTLGEFYSFLEQTLRFKPLQSMDSYQYGIALGGLEMDPLTLAHYFTIFANAGELKPLKLIHEQAFIPPMEADASAKHVGNPEYVQLVNKILTNRIAGVEQFGLKGNLNLSQGNYAVKTGTSRDFHDTWTVGFTPDFLVAVWLGNVENEPMRQITSTSGAGKIWHESMELLINSPYNKKTPFDFSKIVPIEIGGEIYYGLPGDNVTQIQNLLADTSLILNPHDGDTFSFETGMQISFRASASARWYANDEFIGESTTVSFHPDISGNYTIEAVDQSKKEVITIRVVKP